MTLKNKDVLVMNFSNRFFSAVFNQKLYMKFMAIMLLISILPLVMIGVFTFYFSSSKVSNEYVANSSKNLKQLSDNIDNNIRQMEMISMLTLTDTDAQRCLRRIKNQDYVIYNQDTEKIQQLLTSMNILRNDISGIYMYVGRFLYYHNLFDMSIVKVDVENEEWYKKVIGKNGGKVLFPTHKPFYEKNKEKYVFSLSRAVINIGSKECLGVVVIDSNFSLIKDLCKNDDISTWTEIIDEEDRVIYSTNENEIGAKIALDQDTLVRIRNGRNGYFTADIQNQKVFLNYYTSSYTGWKTIQFVPLKTMMKTTDTIGMFILMTALVCIVAIIILTVLIAGNLSRPIINLNNIIKEVGKGNFVHHFTVKRKDEIGQLARGVEEMIIDLQSLIKRTTQSQLKQKEAEFKALQNQINPHFLYNTLESINMKAILNDQLEIAEMVSTLGRLFKLSINKGEAIVKLQHELEHVEEYMKIQKMRYQEKIDYHINFDSRLRELYTIKLILQPIVENAIYHGLENKATDGMIIIDGKIIENSILISIHDNGIGMENEELGRIQKVIKSLEQVDSKMKNIGIKNVNDRLKLYFGEQYGLSIESVKGEGTTVHMKLPVISSPSDFIIEKVLYS